MSKSSKTVKCVDVGMACQVKLPKSVDTRSQQRFEDTSLANTWRLSNPYLITNYSAH